MTNKIPIKCKNPECNYEWLTKSKHLMVSCPSCGTKNKIEQNKNK